MVSLWFQKDTVTTITLKNIPPDLHARLKESAERNRRSLNSEILVRLECALSAPRVQRYATAQELKAFTDRQPMQDHSRIDRFKKQGRR